MSKRLNGLKRYLALSAAVATAVSPILSAPHASADALYFDPGNAHNTPGSGGTGTWDNGTTPDWYDGTTSPAATADVTWNNAGQKGTPDFAVFDTTGGIVTLNTAIVAAGLTFNVGGYTLNSAAATNTLTINGGTVTQSATITGTNTINAPVVFTGTNTVNVNGGTLALTNTATGAVNSISAGTTFNVASGATLSFNAVTGAGSLGSGAVTLNGGTLNVTPTSSGTAGAFSSYYSTAGYVNTNNYLRYQNFGAAAVSGSPTSQTGPVSLNPGLGGPTALYTGGPSQNFISRYTGSLQIVTAGSYTFQTNSDDGTLVYIDNKLVVNNDGGHGGQTITSPTVTLAAGFHEFRVDFNQGGGGDGVIFNYSGPDTANTAKAVGSVTPTGAASGSGAIATLDQIAVGNNVSLTTSSTISLSDPTATNAGFTRVGLGTLTFNQGASAATLTVGGSAGRLLNFTGTVLQAGQNNTFANTPDVNVGLVTGGGTGTTLTAGGTGQLFFTNTTTANAGLTGATISIPTGGRVVAVGNSVAGTFPAATGVLNPLGSATVALSGGTLSLDSADGNVTFSNPVTVGATGGTIEAQASSTNLTLGSPVTLATGSTLNVNTYATDGQVGNTYLSFGAAITGSGNITKVASFQPGVSSNLGVLNFGVSSPSYTGTTTLAANSGAIQGNMTATTDVPFGTGTVASQGGTIYLRGSNATNGVTYALNNAVSLTGDTTFNLAQNAGGINDLVQFGNLTSAGTGTRTVTQTSANGYNLGFTGLTATNSTVFNVGGGILQFSAGGTSTLATGTTTTFNALVAGGAIVNLNGSISGAGSLATGATSLGVVNINAGNSYAGATTFAGGTVNANVANALSTSTVSVTGTTTLNLSNPTGTAGSGNISLAAGTLLRTGTTGSTGGIVSGPGSGTATTTIAPGGVYTAGGSTATIGTLSVAGLTASATTNLNFDLTTPTGSDDLINVNNANGLTATGTVPVSLGQTPTAAGTYHLISFTSTGTPPAAGSFTLTTAGTSRITYALAVDPNSSATNGYYLDLVASTVGGSQIISTFNNPTPLNSSGVAGTPADWNQTGNWSNGVPGLPGDQATINNGTSTALTINLNGNQRLGALTFGNTGTGAYTLAAGTSGFLYMDNTGQTGNAVINNNTNNNTISAPVFLATATNVTVATGTTLTVSGAISGGVGLNTTATSAGTLLLSNANAGFSGPVAVNGGTVQIGTATSLGTGAVTVSGGTLDVNNFAPTNALTLSGAGNGGVGALIDSTGAGAPTLSGAVSLPATATLGGASNFTLSGLISGAGGLTKVGANNVSLSNNANTFTGNITINAGTLTSAGGGASTTALGKGNVTVNAGGTLVGGAGDSFGYSGNGPSNFFINGGTITDLGTSNYRVTIQNVIFQNGGTLTSATGNAGDGNGTFSSQTGVVNTLASANTAVISTLFGLQAATTFNVAAGTTPSGVDLSVTGALVTYSGGGNAITKTGNGYMQLSGANTYAGTTTVSAGTLALSGTSASLAAGAITVNAGATFASKPGTGANTSTGTLSLNAASAFTMVDGAAGTFNLTNASATAFTVGAATGTAPTLTFEVGTTAADKLVTTGTTVVAASGGKIALVPLTGANAPTPGSTYTVIQAAGFTNAAGFTLASNNIQIGTSTYPVTLNPTATAEQIVIGNTATGAATLYFSNSSGGSNWSTATYTTDSAGATPSTSTPNSGTDLFYTTTNSTNGTSTVDTPFDIRSLTFVPNSNVTSYVINGTSSLTIEAGGINSQANAPAATVNAPVVVNQAQTWTNNSSNTLTVGGGVTTGANLLTIAGTGATTLSGTAALSTGAGLTVASGTGQVTVSAPVTLTAASTFTNNSSTPLVLSGGVTGGANLVSFAGTGTGGVNVSGTTAFTTSTGGVTLTSGGPVTISAPTTVTGAATFTNNSTASNLTFGAVSIAANTLTVTGSGNTYITGNLAGTAPTGTNPNLTGSGVLTKTGTGTLFLQGASNQLVTLNLNSASIVDIGSGTLSLNNGGGGTIVATGGGTINATGGGSLKFSSNTYPNFADNGTASGTTLTINAKIISNGGAATSDGFEVCCGGGTVVLTANNTFTGDVQTDGGILQVPAIGNVGTASPVGMGTNILIFGNAAFGLRYTGTGETNNRVINLYQTGVPTGFIDDSGTGTLRFTAALVNGGAAKVLTLQGSTAGVGEFSGAITNNSATNTTGITKAGTGTWILDGTNTYSGPTTISGGTLQIGSANSAAGANGLGTSAVANSGTLAFGNTTATTMANVISGAGAVTQIGAGTTTLTANNTYTGTTTVNAGALFVNGTHGTGATLAGNYSIASAATLGGTGIINLASGAAVTVASGGNLTPGTGTSVSTLTVNGPSGGTATVVSLASGSRFNAYLAGATDTSSELFVTNGAINLGGATLNLTTDGQIAAGQTYTIVDPTGPTSIIGQFAGGTSGVSNGIAYTLAYNTTASPETVTLTVNAVPEPASVGLLGLGALGLLARRRRRPGRA